MVMKRPPGSTGNIQSTRTVYSHREFKGKFLDSRTDTWVEKFDSRSSYAKGGFISFPDGSKFRMSTSYSRSGWEIGSFSPAVTKSSTGYVQYDYGQDGYLFNPSSYLIFGASTSGSQVNEAVTKALTKIADQKVNLGENLATLGQTVRMFTSRAGLLADALHSIRRDRSLRPFLKKSIRDIRREGLLSKAASNYLEYVYGLKPLVQDVFTLHSMIKDHSKKPLLLKAVGTSHRTYSKDFPTVNGSYSSFDRTVRERLRTKCTLWARIDPNHSGLRAANQLGLLNPFGLAWDLVPYSFVVDWFVPVGAVLYAMSAPAGLLFVDGSLASKCDGNHTIRLYTSTRSTGSQNRVPAVVPCTYQAYNRTALRSWPIPGLWFDSDPFRSDRPLKALALSIQALKR